MENVKDIKIKRVYEDPDQSDGYRVLVDRLWPRGKKKADIKLDEWCQNIAPSAELRKWFAHRIDRFDEFEKRYEKELRAHSAELNRLRTIAVKQQMTLLYATKDPSLTHARILRRMLLGRD